MPANQRVAVDSHPLIIGIYDTINSTLATGDVTTQFPKEFYDSRALEIMDRIAVEGGYNGFKESFRVSNTWHRELLGDCCGGMRDKVEANASSGPAELKRDRSAVGHTCGQGLRFALSGCHDST